MKKSASNQLSLAKASILGQSPSLCKLLFFLVMYIPSSVIRAEWIEARLNAANNNIWINTDRDAIYVGNDCKPLMQLKHLSGRKPRSLEQRQQAFNSTGNDVKQFDNTDTNNADQINSPNTPITNNFEHPDALAAVLSPDPLNLNYQTQPIFDPLNRNLFNIHIDNVSITLINQHSTIKARIIGRYDRRAICN